MTPFIEKDMASSRPLQNAIYPAPGFNEDEKRSFWPADVEVAAPYLSDHCFYFVHDEDYLSLKSFDWKGRLEKAGAKISNSYNDKVTVVVVKYRDSPEYIRACRDGKIVATMWWVSNTLMRQRYESPTRRLLDYPVPRGGIPGMENVVSCHVLFKKSLYIEASPFRLLLLLAMKASRWSMCDIWCIDVDASLIRLLIQALSS